MSLTLSYCWRTCYGLILSISQLSVHRTIPATELCGKTKIFGQSNTQTHLPKEDIAPCGALLKWLF